MDKSREKMKEFVDRLWENPALVQTPVMKKENQILGFLRENQANIQKVFSSPEYFPDLPWNEVMVLFLNELIDKVLNTLSPRLQRIEEKLLQPEILHHFDPAADLSRENFRSLLLTAMKSKPVRDHYMLVFDAISMGLYERYLPEALDRRKVIYIELVRRDRLDLDISLVPAYLNLASLFRPLFQLKFRMPNGSLLSLFDVAKDSRKYESGIQGFSTYLEEQVGAMPQQLFKPGLDSNLPMEEHPEISGAAKLIAIMTARAADFDPNQKQDRGAESPDKSWFSITRRNAKRIGFDGALLDDLYQIAGDKGW